MAELFANKYRIQTARLQSWDYANEGMYFITICTKNREKYFGEIVVETQCIASQKTRNIASPSQETRNIASLQSTEIGQVAYHEWFKTPELRPDMNLELGEFVVMPNHIHGIVIIGENEYNAPSRRDAMHSVSTDVPQTEDKNRFGPQSKNLASIIRGYKSAVTTYARKNNIEFDWQSRFHEHIIRSGDDYHRISNYILNNPAKWQEDKFYA